MRSVVIAILSFILLFLLVLLFDNSGPVIQIRKNSQSAFSIPRGFLYAIFRPEQKDLITNEVKIGQLQTQIDTLKKENDAFRSQFDTALIPSSSLLPARIVGFVGETHAPHTFIIDQGRESGVAEGMAVVFQEHLIGVVSSASEKYSEVYLPTHERFRILGKVAGKDATGVIVGGNNEIHFENVVSKDEIGVDDVVMTQNNQNAQGMGVGDDIVIGKIVEINSDRSVPLKSALLKSYIVFPNLHSVFVAK